MAVFTLWVLRPSAVPSKLMFAEFFKIWLLWGNSSVNSISEVGNICCQQVWLGCANIFYLWKWCWDTSTLPRLRDQTFVLGSLWVPASNTALFQEISHNQHRTRLACDRKQLPWRRPQLFQPRARGFYASPTGLSSKDMSKDDTNRHANSTEGENSWGRNPRQRTTEINTKEYWEQEKILFPREVSQLVI